MTRSLRRPLWRWEPAPYLLVIVLILITSAIRPDALPVLYWIFAALTAASVVLLVIALVLTSARRSRTPSVGVLRSLAGMDLVQVPSSGGLPTPVVDTFRHQSSIETATSWGRAPGAVLIPDATRWLGLRIRVAVHLAVDDHVYHVGFLPEQATETYNALLAASARQRRFALVPAALSGPQKNVTVTLDLGELAAALRHE